MYYNHPPIIETMLIDLVKDKWSYVSIFGMSMMAVTSWISTHLNPVIATIAGLLGLVMLILGIVEKAINIKRSLKRK